MSRRGVIQLSISLVVLGMAGWVFLNRQYVSDQLVVWQFQPSSQVVALASNTRLSDKGRFYFFTSQPELSNKDTFNKHCSSQEQQSVILGCYTQRQIYVYNVTDERLSGVKEVTAAHEMLHAAYDRLSDDEKVRVNRLLEKELATNTNQKLQERLKLYERTEPGERDNELHSIFGTESAQLGAELEAYYQQYFTDRSKVISYYQAYESIFLELETQQKALVSELGTIADELEARTSAYNATVTTLNTDVEAFNTRASVPGGFASQAEFAEARAALLDRQQALEDERTILNQRIEAYEVKRKELESLNLRAIDLRNSLDSTPAPVPSV